MDIQTLIAGSTRIDRLRKEIAAVSNLVLKGFLTDEDYRAEHRLLEGSIVLADLEHCKWILSHGPKGPDLRLYWKHPNGLHDLLCSLPEGRVALPHVERIHGNLDSFVEGIRRVFPQLEEHWTYIRRSAKEGLRIVYSIKLKLKDGVVRFQKLTNLPFPLLLGTKMFLSLEGDIILEHDPNKTLVQREDSDTFVVVGYEHSTYDEFGYLTQDRFDIELEPDEPKKLYANQRLVSLLEANGWDKKEF